MLAIIRDGIGREHDRFEVAEYDPRMAMAQYAAKANITTKLLYQTGWKVEIQVEGDDLFVYLDDERPAPPGAIRVKTTYEAIELLQTGRVAMISLDHDLGSGWPTGDEVAKWIESEACAGRLGRLILRCHSMSSFGREKIQAAFRNAMTFWFQQEEQDGPSKSEASS